MMSQLQALAESPRSSLPSSTNDSQSMRLWGLDWSEHTPWQFGDIKVVSASFAALEPFLCEHFATLFETDGQFFNEGMTDAKRRFLSSSDVFLMQHAGETIGYATGHPSDWSSYYVRNGAVLPAYRDLRLASLVMEAMVVPLRSRGVERMEGDCSPANVPMVRMLTHLGYVVTGTNCSERWGTLLRWTKFLQAGGEANAVFRRQFCAMSFEHVAPSSGPKRRES